MSSQTVSPFLKYWLMYKMHWQNLLTYPLNFLSWRLRQLLGTLTSLTFWSVIFVGTTTAFGYDRAEMISYIFLTAFLQSFVLSTLLSGLAEDIYTGVISNTLVKPIQLFGSWITQEVADKSMNIFFVLVESALLIWIFRPQLTLPPPDRLVLFLLATLLGAAILFFIMLLFGTMGFWTRETWGVRFLFFIILDFTAGKLYPLDILPDGLRQLLFLTPFPYLAYAQTQLFLGKLEGPAVAQLFVALGSWLVILALAFHLIWQRGLRSYGAAGR